MYDDVKLSPEGKPYLGAPILQKHSWVYQDARCDEVKVSPDSWLTRLVSVKRRVKDAPEGSGCPDGTSYHWMWVGDQIATKIGKDSYETDLKVLKFKIGHKRPYWVKGFSYEYPQQLSYHDAVIKKLEAVVKMIEENKKTGGKARMLISMIDMDADKLLVRGGDVK